MVIQYEFSSRFDGDMRSHENIVRFLVKKHLHTRYIAAEQTHGTGVAIIDSSTRGKVLPAVDGLVTAQNVMLAIRTADCVPVLLYDSVRGVIGAAHAGWKGTYGNIVRNVICAMIKLGAKNKDIRAVLGPHIQSCCYAVDKHRWEVFSQRYGQAGIQKDNRAFFLNLQHIIRLQLTTSGIYPAHITLSAICTSCAHDQYFSFRKDSKDTFGEQVAIIGVNGYN
jgi:YfiH family protein